MTLKIFNFAQKKHGKGELYREGAIPFTFVKGIHRKRYRRYNMWRLRWYLNTTISHSSNFIS